MSGTHAPFAEYQLTDAERDQLTMITVTRGELATELDTALTAIRRAQSALNGLMSPSVYDIEYTDTDLGPDVAAFCASARRDLTAARTAVAMRDVQDSAAARAC